MSIHTPGTHENIVLAQNVNGRLRAESRIIFARAFLHRATGAGIFVALAGIGIGAASYGWATLNQFDTAAEKIAAAMQTALSDVTLKTKGEVTLTDTTLKLEQPAALPPQNAAAAAAAQSKDTEGGFDTRTTYTLFKAVDYLDGSVTTGWNYLKTSKTPETQYCYFSKTNGIFSTDTTYVSIATNRQMVKTNKTDYNLDEMYKRCIWFDDKKSGK